MGGFRRSNGTRSTNGGSSRSRSRDNPGVEGNKNKNNCLVMMNSDAECRGNGKRTGTLRQQASAPEILFDSNLAPEYRRSASKKASGIPMKMIIDAEVAQEVKSRHSSPGVIGRLMGLDTLPSSFGVHEQQKYVGSHLQKTSPRSSRDHYSFPQGLPCRRSTDDAAEFKDVFEVMEATRMNAQRSSKSKVSKADIADIDFIRQKFMDAKRLSTDESLQRSKEFNDALEALVSNKDLLLEFLQEPNPTTTEELHGLNCSQSPHANRITILKPSKKSKFIEADIVPPVVKDSERCVHLPKEVRRSYKKPSANLSGQTLNEDNSSLRQKLSKSSHPVYEEQTHPARIVVLKPSLEKARSVEGGFPLTPEIFHSQHRRQKTSQDIATHGPFAEDCVHQKFSGNLEGLGPNKDSREIAREITKQMRRTVSGGGRRTLMSEIGTCGWDERSHFLPSMTELNTREAFHRSSELGDNLALSFNESPTYSNETCVGKEARKHLSMRWKMAHRYQEPAAAVKGSSTLGEMLAFPDMEASKVDLCPMMCQKDSNEGPYQDGISGACSCNVRIKDRNSSNLSRSKSVSSSSTVCRAPKSSNRKRSGRLSEFSLLRDVLNAGLDDSERGCFSMQERPVIRGSTNHCDEDHATFLEEAESSQTEREIHVNSEESRDSFSIPNVAELESVDPTDFGDNFTREYYLDEASMDAQWNNAALSSSPQEMRRQQAPAPAEVLKNERRFIPDSDDFIMLAEIIDHHDADLRPSVSQPMELESPVNHEEDDHLSPVSVLESSLETEDSCSGGFEKISADLQELRMQLRLLKMETSDNTAEESDLLLFSDDESCAQAQAFSETGAICQAFKDEEERDFSYLLDMLIDFGSDVANPGDLLGKCYLPDCPVSSDVYDKLEKKYSKLILWPRPERKLLFDLANCILVDMIASWMDCRLPGMLKRYKSHWDQANFVEEVWQRVLQRRNELECIDEERAIMDLSWLQLEDDGFDMVGCETENMLNEDILEELIADLLL